MGFRTKMNKIKVKEEKPNFRDRITPQERLTEAYLSGQKIGDTSKSTSLRVVGETIIDGKKYKLIST